MRRIISEIKKFIYMNIRLLGEVSHVYAVPFLLFSVLSIAEYLLPVIIGYLTKWMLDWASAFSEGVLSEASLFFILLLWAVCELTIPFLRFSKESCLLTLSQRSEKRMFDSISGELKSISLLSFQKQSFVAGLERIKGVNVLCDYIKAFVGFIGVVISFAVTIVILWKVNFVVMLLTLTSTALYFTNITLSYKNQHERERRIQEDINSKSHFVKLFFGLYSLEEIKLCASEHFFNKKINHLDRNIIDAEYRKRLLSLIPSAVIEFLQALMICLNYVYIVINIFHGKGTLGDFALFTSIIFYIINSAFIVDSYHDLSDVLHQAEVYQSVFSNAEYKEHQSESEITLGTIHTIRLENVSFKYPDCVDFVIKNVSLTLDFGQYIALVGLNGSGKTTLLKLIAGLYEPTEGTIYYNEVSHRELNPAEIQRKMSMISQEYVKYGNSVYENVQFGDADTQRGKVLMDELGINSFVEDYNLRLLPEVNKNALNISGGQWQKIVAARGLYKKSDVLLLDEPSSALDAVAEDQIYNSVKTDEAHGMKIIVTHRLACIRDVTRVLVMEKGELVQDGTHAELINENGIYRELFMIQADKYKQ